ncbi:hypothetical protein BKA93DRAFT_441419 [Sparassis latifolia]
MAARSSRTIRTKAGRPRCRNATTSDLVFVHAGLQIQSFCCVRANRLQHGPARRASLTPWSARVQSSNPGCALDLRCAARSPMATSGLREREREGGAHRCPQKQRILDEHVRLGGFGGFRKGDASKEGGSKDQDWSQELTRSSRPDMRGRKLSEVVQSVLRCARVAD